MIFSNKSARHSCVFVVTCYTRIYDIISFYFKLSVNSSLEVRAKRQPESLNEPRN